MPAVLQGDHVVIGHDDMVIQCDAQGLKGVPDVVGDKNIFLGGGGDAAGMVVGQHHGGGAQGQGLRGNLPQTDLIGAGAALAEQPDPQELELSVEAGQKGHLISGPKEVGEKQGAQAGAVGDDHVGAGSGGQVPGGNGGDEFQEDHGVLPHAGDLGQVGGGGVQNAGQGAKGLQQAVGQGVDVSLEAGVKQEELQHPGLGEMAEPALQKFPLHSVPMPLVHTHDRPLPFRILYLLSYRFFAPSTRER